MHEDQVLENTLVNCTCYYCGVLERLADLLLIIGYRCNMNECMD